MLHERPFCVTWAPTTPVCRLLVETLLDVSEHVARRGAGRARDVR